MKDSSLTSLNFEKSARSDFRMWLALAVGVLFVACVAFNAIDESPLWMRGVFLILGVVLAASSGAALVLNTSRGCRVEGDDLVWWQMKFRDRELSGKNRIALSQIAKLRIDLSGDGVDIALFDTAGQKQTPFSALSLPHDYEAWVEKLCANFPDIEIERIG